MPDAGEIQTLPSVRNPAVSAESRIWMCSIPSPSAPLGRAYVERGCNRGRIFAWRDSSIAAILRVARASRSSLHEP